MIKTTKMITKLIHSHNVMDTFFSQTDTQELIDNAKNHSFYVSVITNNINEYTSKLVLRGKKKIQQSVNFIMKGLLNNDIDIVKQTDEIEEVLYSIDLTTIKEEIIEDDFFKKRISEVMENKEKQLKTKIKNFSNTQYNFKDDLFPTYREYNPDKPFPPENLISSKNNLYKNREVVEKIISRCLGNDVEDTLGIYQLLSIISEDEDLQTEKELRLCIQESFDPDSIWDILIDIYLEKNIEAPKIEMYHKIMVSVLSLILDIFKSYSYNNKNRLVIKIINEEINKNLEEFKNALGYI